MGSRRSLSWCFRTTSNGKTDLVEMQPLKRWNVGHRYLLTVIDVLSKYAWVVPVKNKTGTVVAQAFEKVLQHGRKPQHLQTDMGKEFYNAPFRRMLEREGIQHFSTLGDAKAFNRKLKERMYRYFERVYPNC